MVSSQQPVVIGEGRLTIEDVVLVARSGVAVRLAGAATSRIAAGRRIIEDVLAEGVVVYGVTTGFGDQSDVVVGPDGRLAMQPRILRSHAAGAGPPLPDDVVRATLLLRANMLAHGYSGVRPIVVETLVALLNAGISPIVPEQGSVGASGDLAPLAHLSLALIGEGTVRTSDGFGTAQDALAAAGIEPLVLEAKEASSLTNGTEVSLALAVLAVADASLLMDAAQIAAAMSFAAMRGHREAYEDSIHALRPHAGQVACARRMRELLTPKSGHPDDNGRRPVHDIYTLRCVPQVLGPVLDAVGHVRTTVEIEMDSVTDNPLCLPESGRVVSGGNFHGHPISLACDYLKAALASVGTFAERRIASLLDSRFSGLPHLLTTDSAFNSGFMLAQYAAASLASENKTLAHPASVDSIPTANGAEDFNSMSATAARQLRQVLANTRRIVAMELVCAAQGIDLAGGTSAVGVKVAQVAVRSKVPFLSTDSAIISELVSSAEELVSSGSLQRALRDATAR